MKYEEMLGAIDSILRAQGLKSRIAQYKDVHSLPDGLITKRRIVRHYLTGQEYELKVFTKGDDADMAIFD